jgi:glutaminyl-peptide cyclotransferase
MANMIVSYHPDVSRRVILCCHYDTRPIADQENNPRRWREPFVSANDGGSGVALLMELGHHMKELKLQVGVDFVFFDGEEYIHDPGEDESYYFLGSRHFAREYAKIRKTTKYTAAILLDMIAGKGAEFPMEQNSVLHASKLVREVWDIAAELNCDAFTRAMSRVAVNDDHIPLNEGAFRPSTSSTSSIPIGTSSAMCPKTVAPSRWPRWPRCCRCGCNDKSKRREPES